MSTASHLGNLVSSRRKALGLSKETLASKVGCSLSTIFDIERGNVDCPHGKTLRGLASVLGVSADELLGLDSKNPKKGA